MTKLMIANIYKEKDISRVLFRSLAEKSKKINNIKIMEFCGTHTHNIFQYGFRNAFKPHITFIAGPGCPVCVTAEEELAESAYLLQNCRVGIIVYGDLMRIPVADKSLADLRADGYPVEMVYSALESIDIAAKDLSRQWVFLGVGFETTMPGTVAAIEYCKKKNIKNLSFISFHKNTRAIINALASMGSLKADGVVLPGHVSAVVGWRYFSDIVQFDIPAVVVGFEPVDILIGLHELINMIEKKETGIHCAYKRVVAEYGNSKMMQKIAEVFRNNDTPWRGIGLVKNGGFEITDEFAQFNARKRFNIPQHISVNKTTGCRCGNVLLGMIEPSECPLFGTACTPEKPVGPCMVSREGTCLAYLKWGAQ